MISIDGSWPQPFFIILQSYFCRDMLFNTRQLLCPPKYVEASSAVRKHLVFYL